jgi:hypothetical protein
MMPIKSMGIPRLSEVGEQRILYWLKAQSLPIGRDRLTASYLELQIMFKLIGSENKHLAASCGSLFIRTLILYGIVGIAVTPSSSIAASDRSKANLNRSNVPTHLIAGESGQAIMTTSGASELALVKHLNKKGVRMHGAFWCGACSRQKILFGKEAFAKLKYVECDPRGINPSLKYAAMLEFELILRGNFPMEIPMLVYFLFQF